MNERIDELFAKALDQAVPETWTTLNPEQLSKLKTKFARLIVEECCDQLYDPNKYSDGNFAKWRIRKHFGIVE